MVCEADALDGGWLVIQQRLHGGLDFYRGWKDYRDGFGSVGKSNEFWLGLEWMHQVTRNESYDLMIEMRNETGRYGYALHSNFQVAGEDDNYRLSKNFRFIEGSFMDRMFKSRNVQFSTFDNDNDKSKDNCGFKYESGWWFFDCNGL